VAAGSTVGTFGSTDPDSGDTFTYTLVAGVGDTDNGAFTIVGDELRISASPDFETQSSYDIRVRTTDAGGLSTEQTFTITVNDLNEVPTALTVAPTDIDENVAAGSTVGTFSSTDPDTGDTFTYTLVAGVGDTDNGAFAIVGDELRISASPDFETQSSYDIRVRTTDAGGLSTEQTFTVTVTDVNEAPILLDQAFAVPAGATTGTVVGSVAASDPDAGDSLTFSIVGGNPGGAFAIDPLTGEITVANAAAIGPATASPFTLAIEAGDAGSVISSATATVDVTEGLLVRDPGPVDDDQVDNDQVDNEEPTEVTEEADPDPESQTPEIEPPPFAPGVFQPPAEEQAPRVASRAFMGAAAQDRPATETETPEQARREVLGREFEAPDAMGQLLGSQRLTEALDQVREELTEDAERDALDTRIRVSAVEGAALVSSFSLIGLLSRAGSLAASALTSLPMWRRVDPLAVLSVSEEERKRREKDLREAEAAEDREEQAVGRLLDDE
jgi:hypothetical protein